MGEGKSDSHLPCLFKKIACVRLKGDGVNNLGAGGLDLLQVGNKIREVDLIVILADDLRFGVVFLQSFFKSVGRFVTGGVIRVQDVELLLLLTDLAIVIAVAAAGLVRGRHGHEAVTGEIRGVMEGAGVQDDDLIFVGRLVDDLHHVAAVRAPEEVDLLLQDHPFGDLLALIEPRHVIGLDQLHQLLFAVDQDPPLLLMSWTAQRAEAQ